MSAATGPSLPWRGTAAERPGLEPPLERMPLRRGGAWRKRWRWVGAFSDELMLCAARVEVGPFGQTFWAVWDRGRGELRERTRRVLAGRGREVSFAGREVEVDAPGVRIELSLGEAVPIESACPSPSGAYTWTRKAAGVPVHGGVELDGERRELRGFAVEDDSAGYHARRTSWLWSAGVGRTADGRSVAWNLVSGINDPSSASERAIWVDGVPSEPEPVSFGGLDAIGFADGSRLRFAPEAERARTDRLPPLFRSRYRAPFGAFSGSLAGLELASGLGVMEEHDALW